MVLPFFYGKTPKIAVRLAGASSLSRAGMGGYGVSDVCHVGSVLWQNSTLKRQYVCLRGVLQRATSQGSRWYEFFISDSKRTSMNFQTGFYLTPEERIVSC